MPQRSEVDRWFATLSGPLRLRDPNGRIRVLRTHQPRILLMLLSAHRAYVGDNQHLAPEPGHPVFSGVACAF